MTTKAERKARRKREKEAMEARKWVPQIEKDRPTPERLAKGGMKVLRDEDGNPKAAIGDMGAWVLEPTDHAGQAVARDTAGHAIDNLELRGVISNEQASAARDFEQLYRVANETTATRDSTRTWEPKGFQSDDGNVEAVQNRKELYLFLGTFRDQLLRRVCVNHIQPKRNEVGALREALNECVRFFK